jgi:hypothetical protein
MDSSLTHFLKELDIKMQNSKSSKVVKGKIIRRILERLNEEKPIAIFIKKANIETTNPMAANHDFPNG